MLLLKGTNAGGWSQFGQLGVQDVGLTESATASEGVRFGAAIAGAASAATPFGLIDDLEGVPSERGSFLHPGLYKGDQLGSAVALHGGDLDGDARPELLVGSPGVG